jgi:hypothetical protein
MDPRRVKKAIELAKAIGTYDQDDRSAQYRGHDSGEALLKSTDRNWLETRRLKRLTFRYALLLLLASTILGHIGEIFNWLGTWIGKMF